MRDITASVLKEAANDENFHHHKSFSVGDRTTHAVMCKSWDYFCTIVVKAAKSIPNNLQQRFIDEIMNLCWDEVGTGIAVF